ncbi:MAG: hypothetical protein QOJ99_5713, partial [Bryobacterales bacterium]|nr:hypothetical protein [Bryobacterales bacterium]
ISFNVSFDASTSSAPPGFFTAFSDATALDESRFTDPITVNMQVGWGEINGKSLNPGDIGQSLTNQRGLFTYAQVRGALVNDATTNADAIAVGNLGITDPTSGAPFVMSNAEAKALGFLAGKATGIDGWVGFSSTAPYTFDPGNRSAPGKYDFIGLAEHEISEVMGRYGITQNGAASGRYSPLDLFRYSSVGSRDLVPQNGAYFSIDGGRTVINTFSGPGRGDLSDWLGLTPDSYNAFLTLGQQLNVSAGDITEMDVIGYNAVPEPGTLGLAGFVCIIVLMLLRRARVER